MSRFVDATGRPGPATWELGRPIEGTDDLPVTGVSWYEAAAYAEFREARLPTLRHWIRAAGTGMGGSIIPLSNFGAGGPAAPGLVRGHEPVGRPGHGGECQGVASQQRRIRATRRRGSVERSVVLLQRTECPAAVRALAAERNSTRAVPGGRFRGAGRDRYAPPHPGLPVRDTGFGRGLSGVRRAVRLRSRPARALGRGNDRVPVRNDRTRVVRGGRAGAASTATSTCRRTPRRRTRS